MRNYNSVLSELGNRRVQLSMEGSEHYGIESHFYEGIFRVTISQKVSFVFVPYFAIDDLEDIKKIESEKSIETAIDARIHTLLRYSYIVTPNENKKNTSQKLVHGILENPLSRDLFEDKTVLYYTNNQEFNNFTQEFYKIDGFEHEDERKLVNMLKFSFMDFIVKNIITSKYFSESDYEWLLSER